VNASEGEGLPSRLTPAGSDCTGATPIERFEEVEWMREFAALLESREMWKLKR
jgi:hypothetical protein